MASHRVIHGRLAKGKSFTTADSFHLIHEMTPGQRSLYREIGLQHLGRPPSKFWGEEPIPFEFPSISKPTMMHIVKALNHPHHVTSELIMSNDKAAAGWAKMGEKVAHGAEKVVEYAGKAAKFVGKHMETIKKIANAVHTGIGVAKSTGLVSNDSALGEADALLGSLLGDSGEGFYRHHLRKKHIRR